MFTLLLFDHGSLNDNSALAHRTPVQKMPNSWLKFELKSTSQRASPSQILILVATVAKSFVNVPSKVY